MAISMDKLREQISPVLQEMSTTRKMTIAIVALVVLGGFFLLIFLSGRPTYRPLFSNLSEEDTAAIVQKLQEDKVPYKLTNGGRTIECPEEMIYDVRLKLASAGLPQGGGVGFELFDRKAFGATEFVQRVNLQRALQGELARTIRQYPQVAGARVHLSLPERSLFVREEEVPEATVVLQLKPGATLQNSQLRGIVHLVTCSVQGLQPHNVHVVDTSGKVLYTPREEGMTAGGGDGTLLEMQGQIEKRLENKIKEILGPIVGMQKVVARVNVDLDPRLVEQTEEQFDPDRIAVRSEQRSSEKSSGPGKVQGGVPGVLSNLDSKDSTAVASAAGSEYKKENETVNYEVNRVTRRTVAPRGDLQRLTVAVLVDGVRQMTKAADGTETWTVVPRSAEEIRKYEGIVKQAVGFNASRGDQFQIASVPFEGIEEAAKEMMPSKWTDMLAHGLSSPLIRYAVLLILGLLFFLIVVRPFVKGILSVLQPPPPEPVEYPRTLEEMERASLEAAKEEEEIVLPDVEDVSFLPKAVIRLADDDPQRFAGTLKAWLRRS